MCDLGRGVQLAQVINLTHSPLLLMAWTDYRYTKQDASLEPPTEEAITLQRQVSKSVGDPNN